MSFEGILETEEGSLFWQLNTPKTSQASHTKRPLILLIHAAVADHTLWNEQVKFLAQRGWCTISYDIMGWGRSIPNEKYHVKSADLEPSPINHHKHIDQLLEFANMQSEVKFYSNGKVVPIGLSMGGGLAIDYTILHPNVCVGMVAAAGGLGGFDQKGKPEEDEQSEKRQNVSPWDAQTAAELDARYWGDGPSKPVGRLDKISREKLFRWCIDIAQRQHDGNGGLAIPSTKLDPPAVRRLSEIKVPVAVAIGDLDDSWTVAGMKLLAGSCPKSTVKHFDTAHMINLEEPEAFNDWLGSWLEKTFPAKGS